MRTCGIYTKQVTTEFYKRYLTGKLSLVGFYVGSYLVAAAVVRND